MWLTGDFPAAVTGNPRCLGKLKAVGLQLLETRKVLLGHRNGDITSHYLAPEIEELLEAANRICAVQSRNDFAENKNGLEIAL